MRQTDRPSPRAETAVLDRRRGRGIPSRLALLTVSSLSALVAAVIAFGVIVALMLNDHATVHSKQELGHITFGQPLNWASQDQSRFDPPFPFTMGFGSPLECPTTVHWVPLGLDVLGVWLALMTLGVALTVLGIAVSGRLRTR